MRFRDREDAGRSLAQRLAVELGSLRGAIVLALPRGGVPVAAEVAAQVDGVLDVFVVRKVGAPGYEELGIGAIAEGSSDIVVSAAALQMGVGETEMERLAAAQRPELDRRVDLYRAGRPLVEVNGRDVVLVDDGLATGVTAEAALLALRQRNPRRLILAAPVCARETERRLAPQADYIVCLLAPDPFRAVGAWYDDFDQITDDEVIRVLAGSPKAA